MRVICSCQYQIRLAGVESADGKESPRPVSAGSVTASVHPLAAFSQFAANLDLVGVMSAIVGNHSFSPESVATLEVHQWLKLTK